MTESTSAELPREPAHAVEPRGPTSSRRTIGLLVVAGLVVAAALAFLLFYRSGRARRQHEATLKATLDKLVTAQEGFYYDSSRYVSSLRSLPAFSVPQGVQLQLATPVPRSWSAVARHTSLSGRHCVVWVGTPPTSLPDAARVPENETRPLCFDDRHVSR